MSYSDLFVKYYKKLKSSIPYGGYICGLCEPKTFYIYRKKNEGSIFQEYKTDEVYVYNNKNITDIKVQTDVQLEYKSD